MEKNTLRATIRPITECDADLMIEFFTSFSEQTRRFFTPHAIDPDGLRNLAQQVPLDAKARRFMATLQEDGREVMAGYVFFWDWHTQIPWFGIGLTDRFQGLGLGNQMMTFAVETARQYHKAGILLTTWKENYRAQKLYLKFGFEMLGQDERMIEYLMILRFLDPIIP